RPGQPERGGGHLAPDLGTAAGGAGRGNGVGELLQAIERMLALLAAERINGHGKSTESRDDGCGREDGGRTREIKPGQPRRGVAGAARDYCAASLPHGGGGGSTGRVRSNSTLNSRPPGRVSSYTKRCPGSISIAQVLVTEAARPSRSN